MNYLRRVEKKNMLGNIIGGFIVILVGTALLPTVAQQVGTAQADGNVTGASDTLVGLTTLFFALAIATSAIGIAAQGDSIKLKPLQSENFDETAEYRLTSLRGQDRSVNDLSNARETDKAHFSFYYEDECEIYSPTSGYKMKPEINKSVEKQRINLINLISNPGKMIA